MNYLLDTNIISEVISKQPNQKVIDFIYNLDENKVFLSVITIGEIKAGIEKLENGTKKDNLLSWLNIDLMERFKFRIVDIDIDTMLTWGGITHKLKILGNPLPVMDSLIGATCKTKNMILITRNEKDFKNINIQIINPFS